MLPHSIERVLFLRLHLAKEDQPRSMFKVPTSRVNNQVVVTKRHIEPITPLAKSGEITLTPRNIRDESPHRGLGLHTAHVVTRMRAPDFAS